MRKPSTPRRPRAFSTLSRPRACRLNKPRLRSGARRCNVIALRPLWKKRAKYRQEAVRQEAVDSRWQTMVRTARRLRLEREDETCIEERNGALIARRDDTGDDE